MNTQVGAQEVLHKYSGAHSPGAERVVLAVRSSPFAPRAIGIAALATLVVVHLVPVDAWVKLSLALWVGICASRAIGHFTHRRAHSCVVAVITDPSRAVEVRFADGRFARGTIVDGSFVAPWLTVIHWRPMQSRWTRTILLLPDMVEESAFRRMRVLLRWCAAL
jgi:toxin CptA